MLSLLLVNFLKRWECSYLPNLSCLLASPTLFCPGSLSRLRIKPPPSSERGGRDLATVESSYGARPRCIIVVADWLVGNVYPNVLSVSQWKINALCFFFSSYALVVYNLFEIAIPIAKERECLKQNVKLQV